MYCGNYIYSVNPITVVIETSQDVHVGFAAEDQVSFNEDGAVVIKEKAQKTLHKYELKTQERNVYQKIWSVDFPPDVNDASIRSVPCSLVDYSYILLQDKNTATLKLSLDSDSGWDSWNHEGIILPCSVLKHVYAVEKTVGEYEILIHDYHYKAKLQPVAGRPTWKDPYLSVCVYGVCTDKVAVTSASRTLDIYSRDSK